MALALLALAAAATGTLTVDVGNVRNNKGKVIVSVCPQNRFLADSCPYNGEAAAHAGTTSVTVTGLPAGQYAAQAFHDENGNEEIDQGMFSIPKEGVGFSRNARIVFSPPKWKDAEFGYSGAPSSIRFDLRYFMGARGPARKSP